MGKQILTAGTEYDPKQAVSFLKTSIFKIEDMLLVSISHVEFAHPLFLFSIERLELSPNP